MLNFWQNRAEMVLKTDESEGKILKICIKIKKISEKFRNIGNICLVRIILKIKKNF